MDVFVLLAWVSGGLILLFVIVATLRVQHLGMAREDRKAQVDLTRAQADLAWSDLSGMRAELSAANAQLATNRAVLQYLLARLNNCVTIGDPAYDLLPDVVKHLGIDTVDLDAAERAMRAVVPPELAWAVERLLTGEPWARDGGQVVGARGAV